MNLLILTSILFLTCGLKAASSVHDSYQNERRQMVESQIERRGVRDQRVLDAMIKVPRHEFVPERLRGRAYNDYPLAIGERQTISQPYIVAFMTELLELPEHAKVLEIGTGSGYQAAVLAEIADRVYSIEIIPALADSSEKLLKKLGYSNISIKTGDGYFGWPEQAPYDGIIVTAAAENNEVPAPLAEQLKEGGKIVIPLGNQPDQMLCVAQKLNGRVQKREIIPVSFVPMTGFVEEPRKK